MSWSCFWYLPLLLSVGRTIEYFCKARFVRRKVIRRSLHEARRTENFITDIEMTKSSVICKAPIVISKQTVLLSAYGSNRNVYTRKQRLEIMTLPWKKNPQCNMLVGTFKGFFLVILELVTFPEWTSSDPGGAAQHQMLHFSL